MDNSIAVMRSSQYGLHLIMRSCSADILRKDLDSTASKPLITNTTYSFLSDNDSPISTTVASRYAITKTDFCFFREGNSAPQANYDLSFIDNRVS